MAALRPGNYGCVKGSGAAGWIIEHGTASPFGHAFVVHEHGFVLEARPSGVGFGDLSKYIMMGAVFNDQEPLTDEFRKAVIAESLARVKAPYDWPAIADLGLRVLGRRSPLLPVGSHNRYICSQFVTVTATAAGKAYCPSLDRWTVSPRTLADRITERSWEK